MHVKFQSCIVLFDLLLQQLYGILGQPSYVAKTKALISCAVTAQLSCVFVFAYAKSRFTHNEAHISLGGYSLIIEG